MEDIDVRAASNIEMSGVTPQFHRKIYSYAVMVSKNCESIEFGITPMDTVKNISADSIINGTVRVDRITDEDNEELLETEQSTNIIDTTERNLNLLKMMKQLMKKLMQCLMIRINRNNKD